MLQSASVLLILDLERLAPFGKPHDFCSLLHVPPELDTDLLPGGCIFKHVKRQLEFIVIDEAGKPLAMHIGCDLRCRRFKQPRVTSHCLSNRSSMMTVTFDSSGPP